MLLYQSTNELKEEQFEVGALKRLQAGIAAELDTLAPRHPRPRL